MKRIFVIVSIILVAFVNMGCTPMQMQQFQRQLQLRVQNPYMSPNDLRLSMVAEQKKAERIAHWAPDCAPGSKFDREIQTAKNNTLQPEPLRSQLVQEMMSAKVAICSGKEFINADIEKYNLAESRLHEGPEGDRRREAEHQQQLEEMRSVLGFIQALDENELGCKRKFGYRPEIDTRRIQSTSFSLCMVRGEGVEYFRNHR